MQYFFFINYRFNSNIIIFENTTEFKMSDLKNLFSDMIRNRGDFSKVKNRNQHFKCFVKESYPHFLVNDNHYYVQAYFTKRAVDGFKSKNDNINIVDLKSRVITITDWTLEMAKVNSQDVFTSYAGLEVRLVVNGFTMDKAKAVVTNHPSNLFRDAEMKTLIQNFHHEGVTNNANNAKVSMPEVGSKGGSGAGVVSYSGAQWSFKEGKTATVDLTSIFRQEKGADALKKLNQS